MAAGRVGNGRRSIAIGLFEGTTWLVSWGGYEDQSVDPPSLPISPVLRDNLDDSVAANVGSSREDSNTTYEDVVAALTVVDTLPVGMAPALTS